MQVYKSNKKDYLEYVGLIVNQVGTAPPNVIEQKKEFNAVITYTRNSSGVYRILSSQPIFKAGKTHLQISLGLTPDGFLIVTGYRYDSETQLTILSNNGVSFVDDLFNNQSLNIKVYKN